jgi:hypothetical protein
VELLATLLLTFFFLLGLFFLFVRLRKPLYQLENTNLICLFEMVLTDKAAQQDWDVFLEMPIRHDVALEKIRSRCIELTGTEIVTNSSGIRLTESGRQEIQNMLQDLKKGLASRLSERT